MPKLKPIRVLVFDPYFTPSLLEAPLRAEGFELEVESVSVPESITGGGTYEVPGSVLQPARAADPSRFDAVLIGNDKHDIAKAGSGYLIAFALNPLIRRLTMITWPLYHRGFAKPYTALNYIHFGHRHPHPAWPEVPSGVSFVLEMARWKRDGGTPPRPKLLRP